MVMYGITVKPVNISSAENRKAQRWLWSASTCVMPPSAVLPRAACRCAVSVGSVRAACRASSATSAAIAKNGRGPPPYWARSSPSGTPATVDTEKEVITMPIARPRRSNGTTSATMVCDKADSTPPKAPARRRATISRGEGGDVGKDKEGVPRRHAAGQGCQPEQAVEHQQQPLAAKAIDIGAGQQARDPGRQRVGRDQQAELRIAD